MQAQDSRKVIHINYFSAVVRAQTTPPSPNMPLTIFFLCLWSPRRVSPGLAFPAAEGEAQLIC